MSSAEETAPQLKVGTFVRIHTSLEVVVGLPSSRLASGDRVPEDHCLVWYGQTEPGSELPRCRTVPVEYCERVEDFSVHHQASAGCCLARPGPGRLPCSSSSPSGAACRRAADPSGGCWAPSLDRPSSRTTSSPTCGPC